MKCGSKPRETARVGIEDASVYVVETFMHSLVSSTRYLALLGLISCSPSTAPEVQPDAHVLRAPCDETHLGLNDVTFLFPLPSSFAARENLLAMNSEGRGGALLPAAVHASIPGPLGDIAGDPIDATVEEARVVAARIDPCFPGPGSTCRKQLRLVAQPIREEGSAAMAIDASIHLFYDLDDVAFDGLVEGIWHLKQQVGSKTCGALDVHPVMSGQGLTGPYASELKTLITRAAGAETLSRVAVMQLTRAGSIWKFFGFDVVNGGLEATPVPRLGAAVEQSFLDPDVPTEAESITPVPPGSQLPLLLASTNIGSLTNEQIQPAVDEAFAIENPRIESPATADCVSCHVADRARRRADRLRNVTHTSGNQYSNASFPLTVPQGRLGIEVQRALGYFGREVSVNQRVVNESAEVADVLNQRAN